MDHTPLQNILVYSGSRFKIIINSFREGKMSEFDALNVQNNHYHQNQKN